MSWFNVDAIKEFTGKVADKVQHAVPALDKEMLQKLTLTSPDLLAERQKLDQEEGHKEAVRDMLAGMMPWETRDPERDILVEECKDAILKLSSDKNTFLGPYPMPKSSVNLHKDESEEERAKHAVDDAAAAESPPPEDSLEKLKTLEPLPERLQNFELEAHVGLIQKLLTADPNLVTMQSSGGGGERERVFWRNYFFHCAWCRYEAGLSIDEIWSDEPAIIVTDTAAAGPAAAAAAAVSSSEQDDEEHTITFEQLEDEKPVVVAKKVLATPKADSASELAGPEDAVAAEGEGPTVTAPATSPETSDSVGFELVGDSEFDDDMAAGEAVDYELDELEAEIARELED